MQGTYCLWFGSQVELDMQPSVVSRLTHVPDVTFGLLHVHGWSILCMLVSGVQRDMLLHQ